MSDAGDMEALRVRYMNAMAVKRRFALIGAFFAAAGVLMFVIGLHANSLYNPQEFRCSGRLYRTEHTRDTTVGSPTETIRFVDGNGVPAGAFVGSVRLCDDPEIWLLDVNLDGHRDVYFQSCGDHGYLTCAGGIFVLQADQKLEDSAYLPGLSTLWASEVLACGYRSLGLGALLVVGAGVLWVIGRLVSRGAAG